MEESRDVTITSDCDSAGRTVWQVGGQIAESGVSLDARTLILQAKARTEATIPGIDLGRVQWTTYRVNRAEGATRDGSRPESVQLLREGNVLTAWPTKLALVPVLAEQIAAALGPLPAASPVLFTLRRLAARRSRPSSLGDSHRVVSGRGIGRSPPKGRVRAVIRSAIAGYTKMVSQLDNSVLRRPLGRTGFCVSSIGFGSFKIGRNQKTKYPAAYDLPDETAVASLLNGLIDLGINYIDTAPAYGVSEERIGRLISHRRSKFFLATKVGETFADGVSKLRFFRLRDPRKRQSQSQAAAHRGARRAVVALRRPRSLHPRANRRRPGSAATQEERGLVRAIGLSGKTADGAMRAFRLGRRAHGRISPPRPLARRGDRPGRPNRASASW